MPMITVDKVRCADAVAGVSCSLAACEVLGLVGHNGSGKSTLGKLVSGALMPDAGTITVDGVAAAEGTARARIRRLVGYVGQNPADQTVSTIVRDEVAFGLRNIGCPEAELARRCARALQTVGLAGFEDREVTSLSGGELQRLVLASVLALEPAYVVLDEVTAQLDTALRVVVRDLIAQLAAHGVGVMVITHDPLEVLCCDRVLVLEGGHAVWEGAPRALLTQGWDRWQETLPPHAYVTALHAAVQAGYDGPLNATPNALARWVQAAGCADAVGAALRGEMCEASEGGEVREAWSEARVDGVRRGANTLGIEARTLDEGTEASAAPGLMARDLTVAYDRTPGAEALHNVSLTVPAGSVTLVAGPSGAGKTTLACAAAGLLAPAAGSVLLNGVPPRPGDVGLAFQNPEAQLFMESVERELAFAPHNQGCTPEECTARVAAAAAELDITDLLDADPFQLSGGQARRVALASILTLNPQALVLDEPTAGLDAPARTALHALVHELAARGLPVLVVSHDLEEWLAEADQVALMRAGTVAWHGTPAALAADPGVFARAGLVAPESWQLAACLCALVPGATEAPDASAPAPIVPDAAVRAPQKPSAPVPPFATVDARVKIVLLLVATIAVFAASAPWALVVWAVAAGGVLAASGMDVRALLRNLRPVLVLFIIILCANLVSCDGSADVALAGPVGLSITGAERAGSAIVRIVLLVCLALSVAASTTPTALADACTSLMRPLRHLGVPVADIGLVLSMALRFIPVVSEEAARIRLAQQARGVAFDEGSVVARVRAWGTVLTPLVVGLFRRADRVAASMDARCYGQADAALRPPEALRPRDRVVLVAGLAGMIALVVLAHLG